MLFWLIIAIDLIVWVEVAKIEIRSRRRAKEIEARLNAMRARDG